MIPTTPMVITLFLAVVVLRGLWESWLTLRQIRHVRAHRDRVPEPFRHAISPRDHRQAADYTVAKARLGLADIALEALMLLAWTLGGGLAGLAQTGKSVTGDSLTAGVFLVLGLLLVSFGVKLPLRAWRVFGIEARFGFNRMGAGTFVLDALKTLILLLVIGMPVVALFLLVLRMTGVAWWLAMWGLWLALAVVMSWAVPRFVAPIFNRFQPLEDDDLRTRIQALLGRCGYRTGGVYVMDASRRSSHGNAYFSGLGKDKRIVFFDTLLEQLAPQEIEAVLAHELGHYRRHHLVKRLVLMAIATLAGLYGFSLITQHPAVMQALGAQPASSAMQLALLILLLPLAAFPFTPLASWLSRRQEFEADGFAAAHADPSHLIGALVKLYRNNAMTLDPDPLYSAVNDSHPPAIVRMRELSAMVGD